MKTKEKVSEKELKELWRLSMAIFTVDHPNCENGFNLMKINKKLAEILHRYI